MKSAEHIFFIVIFFVSFMRSANSFVYNTHNKHQNGKPHINIFRRKAKQLSNRLFPAGIQFLSNPVYPQDPVDHDCAEHRSKRHNINRYHIHPVAHIRLIFYEKSNQEHETAHHKDCFLPAEMQMSLNCLRAHLEHVDKGGDSGKQNRKKE